MHFTIKDVNERLTQEGMHGTFGKGRGKYAGGYIYRENDVITIVCTVRQARFFATALEVVWGIRRALTN